MESAHWDPVSATMKKETKAFIEQHIVNALASLRSKLGMFAASDARDKDIGRIAIMELDDGKYQDMASPQAFKFDVSVFTSDDIVKWYSNALKVTEGHIQSFLEQCREKYLRAQIEPGMTQCVVLSTAFF